MHDVAHIDQARAHATADGRGDLGEAELHLGIGDLCLVGLQRGFELGHERALGFELLVRGRVLRHQRGVALQVGARIAHLGTVARLLRLGLRQLRLQRARVELRQQLSGLHVLAFAEADLVELAVDARLDRHALGRGHAAHAAQVQRHGLRLGPHRTHQHRRGGARRRFVGLRRPGKKAQRGEQGDDARATDGRALAESE